MVVLEQFVRNLRESHLIPPEEVASLQKALQASKTPRSVEDVAKMLVQGGKLTHYQAATISQGRHQSLILGEYVLLDILGKGGMGVVFRARHRLMDRVVALKTLSPAAMKPDTVQRFYREVKAAARLSHPNIVTAYDAGEHSGTHYLVMEFVVGRDLAAIVREKGPLPLRQAVDCAQQAARGLQYAHTHGVVHRDVKPSNLLLSQDGMIKILDMGLARLNENIAGTPVAMDLTGTGQIMGTVDYMSPEQAEDVRAADQRSDIYSLGCTLFYLLGRRPAYGGDTIIKRILAHRDEPIPSVTEVRPDCPESLDEVIQRMMAKRPDDRPQSMADVLAELESCLSDPDAGPPFAASSPGQFDMVGNWLEDLAHADATPSTEGSQVREATLGSRPDADIHSRPPGSSAGGSTIRRFKQQTHRPAVKKSATASRGGRARKIIAAVATLAVVLAAVALTLIFGPHGSNTKGAKPKTVAVSPPGDAKKGGPREPAKPKRPPQGPAGEDAWADTRKRADRLVSQQHFAKAIHEYSSLASRAQDPALRKRCNDAIRGIEAEADAAFHEAEAIARQHLNQRQFREAREAIEPLFIAVGPVPSAGRAKKLLEEIGQAEKQSASKPDVPSEKPKPQPAAISPELLKQRQLDETFTKAMAPVENRVAAWDFQGAVQETEKVRFDVPELTARLAHRREEIRRMADLKQRMIAAITQADPPMKKTDLMLRGINGDLSKAEEEAITATLPNDKQESIAWPSLGPKAVQKMLQRVVRPDDTGDCLAAGLLSLIGRDVPSAEQHFDKARSLGADTAPYMALLAAKEFAKIRVLLDKHKYPEIEAILATLEEKYGKLPWFAANKPEIEAAANEAKRGLREKEAEATYAQAARLYRDGDFYELKPIVERFKAQFADSSVAADPQRKPSVGELEKAVADLGPLVRVQKDGKGDAKTIQEAVNQAARNSVIQIEEAGPWTEQIVVSREKEGLTIRGKKGILPIITVAGGENNHGEIISVQSQQLSLERLVLSRAEPGGPPGPAVTAGRGSISLRGAIVFGHCQAGKIDSQRSVFAGGVRTQDGIVAKNSVFFGHVGSNAACTLKNVLVCGPGSGGGGDRGGGGMGGGGINCGPDSELRHCTITSTLHLSGMSCLVSDCIVATIEASNDGHKIDHCDVYGEPPYLNQAKAGEGCINSPPQFADPKAIGFRLQSDSPCRKAASDGTDMGFAYTSELQELLKVFVDLRGRGRGKM